MREITAGRSVAGSLAVTGDVVESDGPVKGYAVAKDQYVMVEADELAEIAIESSHTVDIEKFVPKASIDDRYRDTPYYLAPEDQPRCHEEKGRWCASPVW